MSHRILYLVCCLCGRPCSQLLEVDFGAPLHCLVICGETHPLERELLRWHMVDAQQLKGESRQTDEGTDEGRDTVV